MRATRTSAALAILALALLTGCGSEGEQPAPPTTPSADPEPAAPSTPTPPASGAREFRMPERCADIVTPATAAALAAEGLELLGGPEGRYGRAYFSDPTPEERVGGMTCVWGDESDPGSTIIVSVAPVSTATRSTIVADLLAQGLNEATVDGAITYAQLGDEVSSPAVLNVVRSESWISVIEALGGEDRFTRARTLADEVTSLVYVER